MSSFIFPSMNSATAKFFPNLPPGRPRVQLVGGEIMHLHEGPVMSRVVVPEIVWYLRVVERDILRVRSLVGVRGGW